MEEDAGENSVSHVEGMLRIEESRGKDNVAAVPIVDVADVQNVQKGR